MPDELHLNPDQLTAFASKTVAHSDDLTASHAATASRLSGAAGGWIGESQRALSSWSAAAQQQSAAFTARIADHAAQMKGASQQFVSAEEARCRAMQALDPGAGTDGGKKPGAGRHPEHAAEPG